MMRIALRDSPAGPLADRLVAVATVLAAAAAVWVLARATPDARGFGTHEQLGLLPCGWAQLHHAPCPTCGVTTAACWVVHLAPLRALVVQPFGAALALAGLGLAGWAVCCLATGRAFLVLLLRLPWPRLLLGGLALALASWGWVAFTFEG